MANVLCIGGHADGEVTDIPAERLAQANTDMRWRVANVPKPSEMDFLAAFDPVAPSLVRYSEYRICALHIADTRHGVHNVTKLHFAHEKDMEPSEALVMLMQYYQNKGRD